MLTLFITGTESIVLVAGAAAGLVWLRPDRLLRQTARPGGPNTPAACETDTTDLE